MLTRSDSEPQMTAATQEMIPLSVPEIRGNEWTYLKECLDTNFVSSVGQFVDRFEGMLADYIGTPFAVAATSGTAALHTALIVAGIQAGDEVLVSTLTFIAPANAIRYVGAVPVFIDAEPEYWQMDTERVREYLAGECVWQDGSLRNRQTGRRVRAILPVHILGHPCDMDPILELARQYNLIVIEDATESLGAKYKGNFTGTLGDIACFSFNGNKIITTGGGGMLVTSNPEWARRARYLTTQAKDDTVEFIHGEVGYNYRLTNIQAALGCAQMEQLDGYIEKKKTIAHSYNQALENIPGLTPMREASWATSIFWMYTILVDEMQYGVGSRALLRQLEANSIQARPLWQPMHHSPVFCDLELHVCPQADRLNRMAISLPCSVGLTEAQMERVIRLLGDSKG